MNLASAVNHISYSEGGLIDKGTNSSFFIYKKGRNSIDLYVDPLMTPKFAEFLGVTS
jgi:hypothetical protein